MKLQETENMVVPVLKNQLAELEESGIISDMDSMGEPKILVLWNEDFSFVP